MGTVERLEPPLLSLFFVITLFHLQTVPLLCQLQTLATRRMFEHLGVVIVDPFLIALTAVTIKEDDLAASPGIIQACLVPTNLSLFRQHPILIPTLNYNINNLEVNWF